jgi:hypothetical protein
MEEDFSRRKTTAKAISEWLFCGVCADFDKGGWTDRLTGQALISRLDDHRKIESIVHATITFPWTARDEI